MLSNGLGEGVDADDVVAVGFLVGTAEGGGALDVGERTETVDDGSVLVGVLAVNLLVGDAHDVLEAVVAKEGELVLVLVVVVVVSGRDDGRNGGGSGRWRRTPCGRP